MTAQLILGAAHMHARHPCPAGGGLGPGEVTPSDLTELNTEPSLQLELDA